MTGGAVASVRRDFHPTNDCDCVVIGAGVVGLAIARAIAQTGFEVIVLESASSIGSGTSSRNSEVIHAGIYYPAGTLKARLCVDGKRMLYDYVQARGIDHRRCGKLVVATHEAQIDRLHQLIEHAKGAGVDDLRLLDAGQARALEPSLQCVAAVLSPSTGIIDSHAFMLGLQGDIEHAGGMVVLCSPVEQVQQAGNGFVVQVAEGGSIRSRLLVNAAGLSAPALAMRIDGLDPACVPDAYWAKGSYFSLAGRAPFDRLVYPVPESGGLGVHLTLDMGGQARFGPDVGWVDAPGDYRVDPDGANGFYAEIRKYWPGLPEGALQPAYAGIRPKICGPEQPTADFMIQGADEHGMDGLVNLFGIESPGLTSALAIAGLVAQKLRVAP